MAFEGCRVGLVMDVARGLVERESFFIDGEGVGLGAASRLALLKKTGAVWHQKGGVFLNYVTRLLPPRFRHNPKDYLVLSAYFHPGGERNDEGSTGKDAEAKGPGARGG